MNYQQKISIFEFNQMNLRIQLDSKTGEPWFNVNDVCTILGLENPRQAIDSHVDEVDVQKMDTYLGKKADGRDNRQKMNYVNESELYALIFGSKKPEAKMFKRWVTSEVLPSIRKTGSYQVAEEKLPSTANYAIDPNLEIQLKIAQINLDQTKIACAERLADRIISTFSNLSEPSKQQLLAHAYSIVTQSEVNYLLPLIEKKTFTAPELAEKYGKSPQAFGKILNLLKLKSPEFAECRLSKSKYSDKQVEQYFYFESVLSILDQYFQK